MGGRDRMLAAMAVVATLFAGCIVVQVFLAGLGVFDGPARFELHRNFGYLFGWLNARSFSCSRRSRGCGASCS